MRAEAAAREALGIATQFLDAADVATRFSFSRPAALISTQGAQIDPYRITHALLARAAERGAQIFDRTRVTSIVPGKRDVRLTTDRGCIVRARHALFATGYESQEFLPKRILQLKSTYALASDQLTEFPGWWEQCLIWETARPYLYLRTTADGRALIGGDDDSFHNAGRRDRRVKRKTERLARRFRAMFPEIDLAIDYRWAGTFGDTKDGLAYIGSVRQMPRCHFALGFGGNGVTFSIIAADILRQTIVDGSCRDAQIFRFDR